MDSHLRHADGPCRTEKSRGVGTFASLSGVALTRITNSGATRLCRGRSGQLWTGNTSVIRRGPGTTLPSLCHAGGPPRPVSLGQQAACLVAIPMLRLTGPAETTRGYQPGNTEANTAGRHTGGAPDDGHGKKRSPTTRPGTASSRSPATNGCFSTAVGLTCGLVPGLRGKTFTRGGILIDAGLDFLLG